MHEPMIVAHQLSRYHQKEIAVVIIAALAYVIAIGSIAIAAIIICGWRGTESVSLDWIHGKASFACRR